MFSCSAFAGALTSRQGANDRRGGGFPLFKPKWEELEARLAPASFAVDAQCQIKLLSEPESLVGQTAQAVVFFESSVAKYAVLRQSLPAGMDDVVLDSGGDGLREMAAFLAGRHGLASIGLVAHGEPGKVLLGTGALDGQSLGNYVRELAVIGAALEQNGELDLWSCAVAAGQEGEGLVHDLALATGAGVAASGHVIGSANHGGNWQLDVRAAGARGEVPFSDNALSAFEETLAAWQSAAPMATPRSNAWTMTPLNDGQVLVTSGFDRGFYVASAEKYNPFTNTWSSAGALATPRTTQTATLLANGKVLVAGGNNNFYLASTELYDPASNAWSAAAPMATARTMHTATLLPNGKVLVAGGNNNFYLASAELYDPATNVWSPAASMAMARTNAKAMLLGNGKVLVIGGVNGAGFVTSAELYDPLSNTWASAGSMATGRVRFTATLLSNGKVLVAGGNSSGVGAGVALASAELYDPATNSWSSAASMTTPRDSATATLLGNGAVLVTGGSSLGYTSGFLSSTELYNPLTNTWSAAAPMSTPRDHHKATLLNNGKVLVAGGWNGASSGGFFTPLASAELFDPGLPAATAPHVVSVTVNGNIPSLAGSQHSRVVSLVVAFDQPVQLDTDALTLAPHTNNVVFAGVAQPAGIGVLPASLVLATTNNITWVVTFSGNTENGADGLNSLQDGVYDFNIAAAKVHPLGVPGISMAGNASTTFHRLFGDVNPPTTPAGGLPGSDFEAVVNSADNLIFRNAFNNPANYKAFLDFNGDGLINSLDNLQFRNRFNRPLKWSV